MNRIRNILSFLLIAGVACVHAAQPIVMINGGSQASGCDVAADAGAAIFQLDATGNVLVNGTIRGTGCGTVSGGTNTPTFGPVPAPAGVVINGGSSVQAGTAASVSLTYLALYASSCNVGTPTTTASCPAITANANCAGSGSPLSCSPANGTVSVPTVASMGANTSCTYTATANCGGGVTSQGSLVVTSTPTGGGGDVPPGCTNLSTIRNSAGVAWSRITNNTSVMFGDNVVVNGVDPKDYVTVWSYPGTGSVPWPGNLGLQTRVYTMPYQYISEKFVVPSDGSVTSNPSWAFSGSGLNTNWSLTVSTCPGDFGQTGTQITQTACKVNQGHSSSGMKAKVSATPVTGFCSLAPGQTYYFNVLPSAVLPVNNVSTSDCTSGTCKPWIGRN
jgi:hypothetical protein